MKKKILIFFLIIIFSIFALSLLSKDNKKKIASIIKDYVPHTVYSTLLFIFNNESFFNKISNDYNVVFLPKTQNLLLDFKKKKLNFIKNVKGGYLEEKKGFRKTFYLEIFEDKLFVLSAEGNLYYSPINEVLSKKDSFKEIKTNLTLVDKNIFVKILDFEIFQNKIYVSKVFKDKNCSYLAVDYSNLNNDIINFNNIFSSADIECAKDIIQAGKIEIINNNLLLTTGADILSKKDETDSKPQNNDSIFGKLLSIDLTNNNFEIFNKGHRNSIGLLADQDLILSTENGPKGGDEINIELKGENYGWDKASYGEKYYATDTYLDHEQYEYKEPLFVFLPSIGISEIIKLDNNFSSKWQNNYLIGSLFGKHLLRIKLDNKNSKVLFVEKIFIGERIRDLVYDNQTKTIFLALEESGSIGYLQNSLKLK